MPLPSQYAIVEVGWGEHKKHLTAVDHESLVFYPTEAAAMDALEGEVASGSKMMAIMKIEHVFKARSIELEEVE